MILNTGLFHDLVCHMPRFYFTIDGKGVVIYRAEPYIMVTFTTAFKTASVFVELFTNALFIFRRQA
jgi:hypothetical protein